jgi:hypothetical protein
MSNLPEAAWLARRRSSLDGHLVSTLAHLPNCQALTGGFGRFRGSGYLHPGGDSNDCGRFYLLLALLLLALAGGEIVYAMVGPLEFDLIDCFCSGLTVSELCYLRRHDHASASCHRKCQSFRPRCPCLLQVGTR